MPPNYQAHQDPHKNDQEKLACCLLKTELASDDRDQGKTKDNKRRSVVEQAFTFNDADQRSWRIYLAHDGGGGYSVRG
jgi:hypothetical protein